MRPKLFLHIFIFQMFFCFFFSPCDALETATHQNMNRYIARNSLNGFSLNVYLKNQLGIHEGIESVFNSNSVYQWLGDGGIFEDVPHWYMPYLRSVNHFHNPLSGIANAGFHGIFWGTFLRGESSILWSQEQIGQQSPGGYYSWRDVRDYFYKALTATDKTTRETNFAETFRGLGQVMHLVEDLSVPEHARDDGHVLPAYEAWVNNNVVFYPDSGAITVNRIPITPLPYSISILTQTSPFPEANIPVARMFDANQYGGINPDVTLQSGIGLSEYTNANFVSPDTIFSYGFPYPNRITSVAVQDWDVPDPFNPGNMIARPYYLKIADGDVGYRLAGVDYLYVYRESENIDERDMAVLPPMDERVFEDYAKKLIPRAVGYAAGLLDYFFRGDLQVLPVPVFSDNSVIAYLLYIKNITQTGETLANGKFSLVVQYNNGSDDVFVSSNEVDSGSLSYGQGANFQFLLSGSVPKKYFINSAKCMLVFKGTLGNEENAVIGKSFLRGKLKFKEEWDNGLNGNHRWYHSTADQNVNNGTTSNVIKNGILEKDNLRYINDRRGRINESFIYFTDLGTPYQVVDVNSPNGILITPNTYLQFKIDDLSINQQPPAPPGYTTAYQYLMLEFNAVMNGQNMNNFLAIEFTQPGQGVNLLGINEVIYSFPLGAFNIVNIYNLFQRQGIAIPDPFYLQCIQLNQKLENLADPSTIEHRQHMGVDFMSIVEANEE